jgi:hypothetical protein
MSQTPYMIVEGGKDAILKLLNRAALPGVGGELQTVDLPGGLFSAPAIWTQGSNNALGLLRLQQRGYGLSATDELVGHQPTRQYLAGESRQQSR